MNTVQSLKSPVLSGWRGRSGGLLYQVEEYDNTCHKQLLIDENKPTSEAVVQETKTNCCKDALQRAEGNSLQ